MNYRGDTKHAVYANSWEAGVTFRIGQPVDWDSAIRRWTRLDDKRGRAQVRNLRRKHRVRSFEVRAVDVHGRGLGSERHASAIVLPYRALRVR
jgi:hypothetical protein